MQSDENRKLEQTVPTGEQTIITDAVLALCERIPGERGELVRNIAEYIRSLKSVNTERPDFSRTAEEIIQSGYQQGCHEAGVVFATILRAKNLQTTYIQAFLKEGLSNYGKDGNYKRQGHVFLRVQTPDGYRIINSITGEITQEIPNNYVPGKEGLDSWDIELKTPEDYINLFLKTKVETGL